jgi:hypothetical protein
MIRDIALAECKRVYRRHVPLGRRSLPHSVIEMQIVGEAPAHLRGYKFDACTLQDLKPC